MGQLVGHTVGDPIALARSDSFNPLTSQTLDKGQLQEAKLGILTLAMPASRPEKVAADVAKEIVLTLSKHGEAAEHVAAAIATGHPDVLTINRAGAAANRQAATGGSLNSRERISMNIHLRCSAKVVAVPVCVLSIALTIGQRALALVTLVADFLTVREFN